MSVTQAVSGAISGAGGVAGGLASMVTAYIQPLPPATLPMVRFQFNPDKIKVTFGGGWSDSWHQTATSGPQPQWGGIKPDTVDVPITLDAFALPKPGLLISTTIDTLRSMCLPIPETLFSGSPVAPTVCFGWGPNVVLPEAIVKTVEVTYKRFLLGVPIRADITVRLAAVPMPAPLGPMNPTSGGLAAHRTHTVAAGDTLASIAFAAYRNPNRWRALAEINGIDDPMRLKVGRVISVPDKNTAKALS